MLKTEFTHFRCKPSPPPVLSSPLASLSVQLHRRTPGSYRSHGSSCLTPDICLPVLLLDPRIPQVYALLFISSSISQIKLPATLTFYLPPIHFPPAQKWKLEHILPLKICSIINNKDLGNSLVVQWLGLCDSTAGNTIPGRGAKIPQAAWPKMIIINKDLVSVPGSWHIAPKTLGISGVIRMSFVCY